MLNLKNVLYKQISNAKNCMIILGIITIFFTGCAQERGNSYGETNASEGVAARRVAEGADYFEETDDVLDIDDANDYNEADLEDSDYSDEAASDEETSIDGTASSDGHGYGRIGGFSTTDLQGNDVDNNIFEQRELTFIYLWATWCPPCRSQLPDFQELHDDYGDRVAFVTVVLDGVDNPRADELVDEYLSSFTNLLPEDRLLSDIMPRYVPTTVIVDSEGNLVMDMIVGPRGSEYSQYLDEALSIIG